MGRPKKADPREKTAYARLNEREWDLLGKLTEDRQRELRATVDPSMELSQSDIIRWLILREAQARGLDEVAPPPRAYSRPEAPLLHVAEPAAPPPGERFVERDDAVAQAPPATAPKRRGSR